MIKRNVIILMTSEEAMQGVIRGIEALDVDHEVGIIHGAYNITEVDEVTLILAELAGALIIKTPEIKMNNKHPQGKAIPYMDIELPVMKDRNDYIKYITIHMQDLLTKIIN